MATVAECVATIAAELNMPIGHTKHVARRLQDAGLLPLASGASVPSVTISEVCSLLFALGSDAPLRGAAAAVAIYGDLRLHGFDVELMPESIRPAGSTAREYLEHVIHSFVSGSPEERALNAKLTIEFCSTWPEICIVDRDDRSILRFVECGKLATHWQHYGVRKAVTITGRVLRNIVAALNLKR